MSLRTLLLAFCLLAVPAAACAQDFAHPWQPRSGDEWTDARLADVNAYAARYRDAFVDELVRYFDAPRELVEELVVDRRWAPGDVYQACAIARVSGRPCRTVLDAWAEGYADGWEPIARRFGIEPGSPAALRLRQLLVDSYGRWSRPIEPDAAVQPAAKATPAG